MAEAIIPYERMLPEIPNRCPWEPPTQHLEKDPSIPTGWRIEEGRRESNILLIPSIREQVDDWRHSGYPGISPVSQRLLEYWFEEEHEVSGYPVPFRYWFCQREAIETLIWLVEVKGVRDVWSDLIQHFATIQPSNLFQTNLAVSTSSDGKRYLVRINTQGTREVGIQELPPEKLRRLAFKMATGSGKTWVMAMAIVWSYLHKRFVPDSDLATNFLIIAPNVIVYQRLERDFASARIFHELPLIPPEYRASFALKVILRGEATEPDPSGNLFVTNIQQLYGSRDEEWTPQNAVEAILGRKPMKDLASSNHRTMLERVKSLRDLVVINDEAHHVHDADLAWSQTLLSIHQSLPNGLSLWLDFSATPKDQNGMYFAWTICDYPLAQAVEDRIVKVPIIVTQEREPGYPAEEPEHVNKENFTEKYRYWIHAAVQRWKEHYQIYRKLGTKPVLFIMTERNDYADVIGQYLVNTKEFGFKPSEVLIIHTDTAGEITKKDLDTARAAARDIDTNDIKVIVSVLMLREGWDVRNVTVVLGLRPFTAKAQILPEQVVGRGLRLMPAISPDRTQTLEVLGTKRLLETLREQLDTEHVGYGVTDKTPQQPFIIAPVDDRKEYDIAIPIPKPRLSYNPYKLDELSPNDIAPVGTDIDLSRPFNIPVRMEEMTTEAVVHQDTLAQEPPIPQELISRITNGVIERAKLSVMFAQLYPIVQEYLANICFGRKVDLEDPNVRSYLSRPDLQDRIIGRFVKRISELTIEERPITLDETDTHLLSETKPFSWRRNLPPPEARKTIFNYVATYNDFEREFALFLDRAPDVVRFASLATTEQGESGTAFRVDYIKSNGVVGFYYPDWVVVQNTPQGEVNWIVETKGRVWVDTEAKDRAIQSWCQQVTRCLAQTWRYIRVNQSEFERIRPSRFQDLLQTQDTLEIAPD